MAAAVKEYTDGEGIGDVLGEAGLMALIGAVTTQETEADIVHEGGGAAE